jgi:hypothetical protein
MVGLCGGGALLERLLEGERGVMGGGGGGFS